MITYEAIESFINSRLEYAAQVPANAPLFENQAFGAVDFACTLIWKDNPELESKLISKWNDEWKNLFTQLYA